jgi:zinc transport system substrate-binding protein
MVAVTKAKIYFAVGIEFEKARLKKISAANPEMKVVHTDHGIRKIPMAAHQHHADQKHRIEDGHEPEIDDSHDEDHQNHGRPDPHIWLSPPQVKIQARTILAALQEADSAHRSDYEINFQVFAAEIDKLDADLVNTFSGRQGLKFMVFHPSWGYFANTYGLQQIPVEVEGKNPKPAQLKNLIEQAQKNDIRVIFAQPQFSGKSAALIAREIKGQVVIADPLAEDWAANLRRVAQKFKDALR